MKGTITDRSPGVWWLRTYVGRSATSSPVQISRTVHGGKRLAQAELANLVAEATERAGPQGAPVPRGFTVSELLDRWLEYLTPLREPGTIRGYQQHAKAIKAAVGSSPYGPRSCAVTPGVLVRRRPHEEPPAGPDLRWPARPDGAA